MIIRAVLWSPCMIIRAIVCLLIIRAIVCLFTKDVHVGELRPNLIMVEFLV